MHVQENACKCEETPITTQARQRVEAKYHLHSGKSAREWNGKAKQQKLNVGVWENRDREWHNVLGQCMVGERGLGEERRDRERRRR